MASGIATVYADLIMKGEKTIDQVPARIREKVQEILQERGWVAPVVEE